MAAHATPSKMSTTTVWKGSDGDQSKRRKTMPLPPPDLLSTSTSTPETAQSRPPAPKSTKDLIEELLQDAIQHGYLYPNVDRKSLISSMTQPSKSNDVFWYDKLLACINYDEDTPVPIKHLKLWLAITDWRYRDGGVVALHRVNFFLSPSSPGVIIHYISLGVFNNKYRLALRALHGLIGTPEINHDNIDDDLEEELSVPTRVIGARYEDAADGNEKKTMMFLPLGQIYADDIKPGDQVATPPKVCWCIKSSWYDTGFVLALGIPDSGQAGPDAELYIICDLFREDESNDYSLFPELIRLCEEEPPFTIARVKNPGLSLIKDTWETGWSMEDQLRFTVLSKHTPEIAETFLTKRKYDSRLVPLFLPLSPKV